MQALIYVFIALAAMGVGAAGYFGLAFSIVEAALAGLLFAAIALLFFERTQRRRSETRLENAIEDLSRLLSTDAQAGGVLSQRINTLVDQNAGPRLDALEADISVLGTVVRQVAEAVATLEEARNKTIAPQSVPASHADETGADEVAETVPEPEEPLLSAEEVRQAITEGRLVFHAEPIITLPQRRNHGYDLVARIVQKDGSLLDAPSFLPRQGSEPLRRRIDDLAFQEAIAIARQNRTDGRTTMLYVPISRASLADKIATEQFALLLESNRGLVPLLSFRIEAAEWGALTDSEKASAQTIARKGIGFSLADARSLRLDMAELSATGIRSIRVDATDFIDRPQILTDLHSNDVVAYLKRFSIDLIAAGLSSEQQILSLLDDSVGLTKGPRVGGPAPLQADPADQPALSASRRA